MTESIKGNTMSNTTTKPTQTTMPSQAIKGAAPVAPPAIPLEPTASYATAYANLTAIAERLKGAGTAVSIDTLVQDVRAARMAHAVCRDRLAAVRAEVDAELALAEPSETTRPTGS